MTRDQWPPEREQRLVELAPLAYRVADLAAALDISRNSVIGKLRRMREKGVVIETHFGEQPDRHQVTKRRSPRPRIVSAPEPPPPPPKPRRGLPPPEPVQPEPAVEAVTMRRLTLLELGPRTCRWPVGDVGEPGFFFCGNETDGERPYCPVHHIVAHGR